MIIGMAEQNIKSGEYNPDRQTVGRYSATAQIIDRQYPTPKNAHQKPSLEAHSALSQESDSAILKIARALARQAAREDHARQRAGSACHDKTRSNIREVLD